MSQASVAPTRRRRSLWLAAVLAAAVLAVVVVVLSDADDEPALTVALDGPAPPFESNVRVGQPRVSLAQVAGRPAVINV